MNYLIFDIETVPDVVLADSIDAFGNIKAPVNYKDPEKIIEYIAAAKQKAIRQLAVKPLFAQIRLITMKSETDLYVFRNHGKDYGKEKEIIQKCAEMLHNTIHNGEIVSFNGKMFDLPVLIERGEVVGAEYSYRTLEKIAQSFGDRMGHYDMADRHKGCAHSLSKNLKARFGVGKLNDNNPSFFEEADDRTLELYAIDEILKLEAWYRNHNGYTPLEYDHVDLISMGNIFSEENDSLKLIAS